MHSAIFDTATRKLSIAAITGYQKYISPHKGFACAHRILHQRESCSQYIKRIAAEEGLKAALKKSRSRFQECKQAHQILKERKFNNYTNLSSNLFAANLKDIEEENEESYQPRKGKKRAWINHQCSQCSGSIDVLELPCECVDMGCLDTSCDSLDCSGADCSGADCNFLDCGGCGS
ncbi:membrane protein insertion efficiency factor YidD [Calothrix sp. UHCC 0171]|uniref:membrane protein insertion efficiency factor YidD n=1 Tax=Calothrix sp. UHCC 0171 TaxID=3110245 RepID=UPI002B215B17|nr:membrane protein insertion efficiency factor YidD [Calothrix sp. UHCC 0171]MEA5572825.1 membrane protein insertion efficiency factor YidD [Calothrix sp. UHCC 0171]